MSLPPEGRWLKAFSGRAILVKPYFAKHLALISFHAYMIGTIFVCKVCKFDARKKPGFV